MLYDPAIQCNSYLETGSQCTDSAVPAPEVLRVAPTHWGITELHATGIRFALSLQCPGISNVYPW